MARPRKHPKKPPPRIHDRQATELPINAMVRPVEIADPFEQGATIIAIQNLRDDPLARLYAAKAIDIAQYNAGREMQGYYERAEIGGLKAMDTTKEPVDGGSMPEMLTEAVQKAIKQISRLERELGMEGASIVRDVLARGMFIKQCAAARDVVNDRGIRYIARRFKECLELLAKELNYA